MNEKSKGILIAVIVILLVGALAAIAILTGLYLKEKFKEKELEKELSTTPKSIIDSEQGRIDAANYILGGLNEKADPCDDFYEFACGNWTQNFPLPHGRRLYDTFTKLQDDVYGKVYSSIRKINTNNPRTLPVMVKLRRIFDSCTDMVEMDRHVLSTKNPLVQLMLNSKIGMWPLLQVGWTPSQVKLSPEGLAGLLSSKYGVDTFLSPKVSVDWGNVRRHSLYLDQADLTLGSRTFYLNGSDVIMREYVDTIESAARMVALDLNGFVPVSLQREAHQIAEFELNLAEIMVEPSSLKFKDTYNPFAGNQLKSTFPKFNWFKYFSTLLPLDLHYADGGPSMQVIVLSPEYLNRLSKLLSKTPVKTVYNYLVWRLIYTRLWALSAQYRDLHRALRETLNIAREAPSQSEQCISMVTEFAGLAVGRLFVEDHFNKEIVGDISFLIKQVLRAQRELIQNATWMDVTTKQKAIAKVDAIEINAAFPQWIMNNTLLEHHYSNLTIQNREHLLFFNVFNNLKSSFHN